MNASQKHRCPHCGAIPATWPRSRILEACQTWANVHGKPPTAAEWRASTPHHPSHTQVALVFDNWNTMLKEAGFGKRQYNSTSVWGRPEILEAIFKFKYEHGRLPRFRDWLEPSEEWPQPWRVQRVFGSWSGAIVAAGYEPRSTRRSKLQLRAVAGRVTRRDQVAA